MTETGFGEFHNGGTAEMPPAEAEPARETPAEARARRKAEKAAAASNAEPSAESAEAKRMRETGKWHGRNEEGKVATFPTETLALKFACPPDRVVWLEYGQTLPW